MIIILIIFNYNIIENRKIINNNNIINEYFTNNNKKANFLTQMFLAMTVGQ